MIDKEGSELLAELFNRMTKKQKLAVPQPMCYRISRFMVDNGYRFVFGRWYLQSKPRTSNRRITDGERGFRTAVRKALAERRMHNPAVHWSAGRGFFVCPAAKLIPMDEGEVEVWEANRSANTGLPYCLPDYSEVREICGL